jgi:hypothetical protein
MPTMYGYLDLVKNELRNAVVQNIGSAPSSPVKGQIWMDSTNNILKWWDGTQWVSAMGGAGAVPSDAVSTQAIGDAAAAGASTLYARGDHKHAMPAFGAATADTAFGSAKADGSAVTLARADHIHGNPTHDAAAHSAIPLSALAVPTGALSLNSQLLTNVGTPVSGTDGANKNYVDTLVQGLDAKASVHAGTTVNIANLAGGAPNALDGITLAANDRVLVKDQSTTSQNGIYVVSTLGTGVNGTWTRATDMDAWAEVPNAYTWVEMGTVNADTGWVCISDPGGVIGTNGINWSQFSAAGSFSAGAGLLKTGNVIDVVAADTSLTVNADSVQVNTAVIASVANMNSQLTGKVDTIRQVISGAGLTGGGTLTADRTLDVGAGTGITVAADNISVDSAVVALKSDITAMTRKYVNTLTGTASPETVSHNLNTRDIQLTVLNGASPYTAVEIDWDATTVNSATIRYSPNLGAGYRVVVVG